MSDQQKFSRTTRIDILADFTGGAPAQTSPTRKIKRVHLQRGAARGDIGGKDFQTLLQSSYDAALITDLSGRIVDANLRAVEFLGFSRGLLIAQSVNSIVSGLNPQLLRTIHEDLKNDRFVLLQAYCSRQEGSVFPTEIAVIRLLISAGDHLCFFIRDITLRKEAENRLRVGANAIDNAGEGIAITDMRGVLKFVNGAADQLWKLAEGATLVGVSLADLLFDASQVDAILQAIATRQGWSGELQARRGVREEDFFIQLSAAPNVNADDELIGGVLSISDITERKRTESKLHETLEELARSNADLEQFAYVVSHDLQEPLRKIVQFGDMLEKRASAELSEEGVVYVARMRAAAKRMGDLIRGILALSRIATRAHSFEPVDLNNIVREVVSDLEARIHKTAGQIEVGDLPVLCAEQTQMRQLMQNLIANGLKFHKPGQPPFVKVYGRQSPRNDTQDTGVGHVEVVVEDNGIGFDASQSERIFGIFQRLHTRTEYDGTGIGLAICRKIAHRHGGNIRAESDPDGGARFIVTIPVKQEARATGAGGR